MVLYFERRPSPSRTHFRARYELARAVSTVRTAPCWSNIGPMINHVSNPHVTPSVAHRRRLRVVLTAVQRVGATSRRAVARDDAPRAASPRDHRDDEEHDDGRLGHGRRSIRQRRASAEVALLPGVIAAVFASLLLVRWLVLWIILSATWFRPLHAAGVLPANGRGPAFVTWRRLLGAKPEEDRASEVDRLAARAWFLRSFACMAVFCLCLGLAVLVKSL
jgi:hypothetical protein